MTIFSKLWSTLFHPVFQSIGMVALLFYSKYTVQYYYLTPEAFKWKFLLFMIFFLLVSPFLAYLIGIRLLGSPSYSDIFSRRNRHLMYPVFALFYFIFWFTIRDLPVWMEIKWLVFSGFVCLVLLLLALPGMNPSAHAAGCGILLAFMFHEWMQGGEFFSVLLTAYLPLAGLTGSVRLWLKAHQTSEVMAGYLIGIISFVSSYWILK